MPATSASPESARSSVVRMRSVVVFPAPFGPRNPWICPASIERSTPRSASTRPRLEANALRRPVTRTAPPCAVGAHAVAVSRVGRPVRRHPAC